MNGHLTIGRAGRVTALVALGLLAGGLVPLQVLMADSPPTVTGVVPLDPVRILDTRAAIGIATTTPLAAEQTITLQVSGVAGIPANATGVLLNVTVNGANGAGYVSAYPSGTTRPTASVINYTTAEDVANMITATLSPSGAIDLYNAQSSAHLIADVAGYLLPDGLPVPPAPTGLGFRETVPRPSGGQTAEVAVGGIAGVDVILRCGPASQNILFRDVGAGFMWLDYVVHRQTSTVSDVHQFSSGGVSTGNGLVIGSTGFATIAANGTLQSGSGAFFQVEARIFSVSDACYISGSIAPV